MTQEMLRMMEISCFWPAVVVTGLHAFVQTERAMCTKRESLAHSKPDLHKPDLTRRGADESPPVTRLLGCSPLLFCVLRGGGGFCGNVIKDFFLRFFKKDFIYLSLERGEWREKEGERNINVWFVCPVLGTWPATQAWALTGN